MIKSVWSKTVLTIVALSLVLTTGAAYAASKLSGSITIDGSSTVYPITEAVAEEFKKVHKNVKVTVGLSGSSNGIKKICAAQIPIAGASRPIKSSEVDTCKKNGVDPIELTVAWDGISVVINKDNTWAKTMTVAELKKIFEAGSKVKTWKDVNSKWPDETIKIYSPGGASGTFEYFTEHVNDKAKSMRNDSQVTLSEDDNVLVQGVASDKNAIGYFGFAYYEENKDKLSVVTIDGKNKKGPVAPSTKTIANKTYDLSRPIFIYVDKNKLNKPEIKEFAKFYMLNASKLVKSVGYVPLSNSYYYKNIKKLG